MAISTNRKDELLQDLGLIYNKLEQIRDPDFFTIFGIVFKVLASACIIELIAFVIIAIIIALFWTSIAGGILILISNAVHSIKFIQPTPAPYNFIMPFLHLM